ncbi:MAG: site-specific integrase [Bdellovibrionales bacterium]|nr:site-specific integrase [Bdellovibrionales bacterium]
MAIIKRRYRNKKQQKPITYYQAEVFVKGVRVAVKNFSQKREAVVWHEKQQYKFRSNPTNLNDRILFKDCVEDFYKDAKLRILQSSYQRYEHQSTYLYKSPLAKVKMSELKGFHVVEWINWLKKHPTVQSKRRYSFKLEIKLLNTILTWYKNFHNEDFNVPITKKHKQLCIYKPHIPRRPDHFIQPDDAKRWIEQLREYKSNPVYWKLATFMLLTGARISEACGLKWDAVDLTNGVARVVRRVRWDYHTKQPYLEDVTKTVQSARLLMLPKKLTEILKEIKQQSISDVIFTNNEGKILKYNAIQSAFNHSFKKLNLPWRSTHICRHTFATIALMGTKNLSAVQASLGHTQQSMTQKYAKAVALLSSDIGEKTSAILFKTAQK